MEAIAVLHDRGFGRLRLLCYVKEGLSAWRHRLFAADEFTATDDSLTPIASLPGWPVVPGATAQEIADNMQSRFPELMQQARGEPGEYAAWLKTILLSYPEGILEMELPNVASLVSGEQLQSPFNPR